MGIVAGELPGWASSGSGSGYGDGSGYGYGSGEDIAKCQPETVTVTRAHLRKHHACASAIGIFDRAFPNGAEWPGDIRKAKKIGLDVGWATTNLGLLQPSDQ